MSIKPKAIESLMPDTVRSYLTLREKNKHITKAKNGKRYLTQIFLTSLPLILADILSSIGSYSLAIVFHNWMNISTELEFLSIIPIVAILFVFVNLVFGLYPGSGLSPIFELRQSTIATNLACIGLLAASLPLNKAIPISLPIVTWIFAIFAIPMLRFIFRQIFSRFQWWGQPVLIIGDHKADYYYDYITSRPHYGLRPIGIVSETGSYPHLGSLEMAQSIAKNNRVFWAVVAMPEKPSTEDRETINSHVKHFPHVLFVEGLNGMPSLWNRSFDFGQLNGIWIQSNLLLPIPRLAKKTVDISVAFLLGLFFLPAIAIIILLIKLSSPGPVFYSHERIGHKGRLFKAWKFRSMVINGNSILNQYLESNPEMRDEWEKTQKLKNDPRVTKIGYWLRKTSLDELPQLWNVLVGEMSLVGPRPIVEEEIERYGDSFDLYTRVTPGLTGLWQISGRNNTTYKKRVRLDSYYVRNWSPWMDIYILARTIKVVIFFEGAY